MQLRYPKLALLVIAAALTMADQITEVSEVYTPNGSKIFVYRTDTQLDPNRVEAYRKYYARVYPKAIILEKETPAYNCHHYAWHINAGNSDKWWMTDIDLNGNFNLLYITDGSYTQVSKSDPKATHLVYFGNGIEHSAIKSSITDYAVSKWGNLFTMRHPIKDCPYSTSDIRYYKLSMNISGPSTVENDMSTPIRYTLLNAPAGANISWTVQPKGCLLGGQGTTSITVKPSPWLIISAQSTMKGCKVNIPEFNTVCTTDCPIKDIMLFRYGQSNYDFTLRAVCDVSSDIEIKCVWSCDDPGVKFYELEYPDDAAFADGAGRFTSVRFPRDGSYNISVYAEVIGDPSLGISDVFTKTISVSSTMNLVEPPLVAE